jgi:hypothetical protein
MLEYKVGATRIDSHGSEASTKQKRQLLHTNVRKYGTNSNTLALSTKLDSTIKRAKALSV